MGTRAAAAPASQSRLVAILHRGAPLLFAILLVSAIVLIADAGPVVIQRRVTLGLIYLIAVVGLYVFVGNSGVLSFGNVSFMAIGAYVSALLTMQRAAKAMFLPHLPALIGGAEWPPLAGALAGACVAAVVAAVAGLPLVRLSGISGSIATFALLVITNVGLGNWTSVTGGQQSLMGLPIYTDLWIAFGWAVFSLAVAFLYQESRSALALRASREDEVAARASGVRIHRERLVAFTISGFLSGLAGVLFAHLLGALRVDSFYLDLTFLITAMLVIGGMASLTGAVIGTVTITAVTEGLRQLEAGFQIPFLDLTIAAPAGLGDALLALAMLLILLFRPDGLAQGREISWPVSGGRGSQPSVE